MAQYISKNETLELKGIAIILMLIHHFFCFPQRRADIITYPFLDKVTPYCVAPTKICVCVFAFLTGYSYYYHQKKDLKYSLGKIFSLWKKYVYYFVLILIPIMLTGGYKWLDALMELFLIKLDSMTFCWYVRFYFLAMLSLPLFAYCCNKSVIYGVVIQLSATTLIFAITNRIGILNSEIIGNWIYTLEWLPVLTGGYIVAKLCLFEKVSVFLKRSRKVKYMISIFFIILSMAGRYLLPSINLWKFTFSMDIIYTPLFVFFVLMLLKDKEVTINKVLVELGKKSMGMWFIHAVFFNRLSVYTQKFLYFPRIPILVLLWGVAICYFATMAIEKFPRLISNIIHNMRKGEIDE